MPIRAYNEHSGIEYEASFFDAHDNPSLPTTVHWRLDCETTKQALQDWTAVTPVAETDELGNIVNVIATIEVAGELNAIVNDRNRRELKTLTIAAEKDNAREFNTEVQYYVMNLYGR